MSDNNDKKNIIIMDTNIYKKNFYMRNRHFRELRDSLSQLNLVWGLPEIVFDETVWKYKENIEEVNKDIIALNEKIKNSMVSHKITYEKIDVEIEYKKYSSGLKKLFENSENMTLLPYPQIGHKEIASLAISKRKPFKENGDGYRDTLLWETVLNVLKSEKYENILFVTNDKKDFLVKKGENKNRLHPDLYGDVELLNLDPGKIEVFDSLYSLVTKYIQQRLTELDQIKEELHTDNYIIQKETLKELLSEELLYKSINVPMPYSNDGECIVTYINTIIIDAVENVRRLNNDRILVEVNSDIQAEFEYFVDKMELYADENPEYRVEDPDWNKWVAQVSIERTEPCSAIFIINEKNKEVELIDYEFENARHW